MWLLWNPFPLLQRLGGYCYLSITHWVCAYTFSDMTKALQWPTPRYLWDHQGVESEVKAKWTAHTKMELMTLTSLTKCTGQQSWCLCPKWLKWGERKTWERRTYLALSVLLLQERILTEKKNLDLVNFVGFHQVQIIQREKGCLEQRCWRMAWIWGDVMGQIHASARWKKNNVSISSNLCILPPAP